MLVTHWIILKESGEARLSRGKPDVRNDEVAIRLNIEVKDALFKNPQFEANLKVLGDDLGMFVTPVQAIETPELDGALLNARKINKTK